METGPCPICNQARESLVRYPNSVCIDCCNTGIFADPSQTTAIYFGNADFSGGFQSCINGVIGNQHICYIMGQKCYADESRFGGIVINYTSNVNDNEDADLKKKYKKEYNYYLRSQNKLFNSHKDNNSNQVDFERPFGEVMRR